MLSKKLISIPDIILIRYSLSFSRIQHIAGLPNLFTGTGHDCGRKVIAGHMHFYQAFLPRNSGFFLAALMAKTNVRPFYLLQNGKPFHEEIKRAKDLAGHTKKLRGPNVARGLRVGQPWNIVYRKHKYYH